MKKLSAILMITIVGLTMLSSCTSDENKIRTDTVESTEAIPETAATEETDENPDVSSSGLPGNLEKCTAYSEEFVHPFSGEELTRKVVGLNADGLCEYKEEMPGDGLMTCTYSEKTRKVIAQYYKDQALSSSFAGTNTMYVLNGKSVKNPLDEAMKNGDCIISGY